MTLIRSIFCQISSSISNLILQPGIRSTIRCQFPSAQVDAKYKTWGYIPDRGVNISYDNETNSTNFESCYPSAFAHLYMYGYHFSSGKLDEKPNKWASLLNHWQQTQIRFIISILENWDNNPGTCLRYWVSLTSCQTNTVVHLTTCIRYYLAIPKVDNTK